MAAISLKFGPQSSKGELGLDGPGAVVNAYAKPLINGKSEYGLYPVPGLVKWATLAGPWRGWIDIGGRLVVVSGQALYEVDQTGSATAIAGLPGSGPVQMARNALADPHVAMIADGEAYVYRTGSLAKLETDFLPTLVGVVEINGRFVFGAADGRFFYSKIGSTEILGDQFYNAEKKPDGLTGIWTMNDELILFGSESREIWAPTQDAKDPFSPLGGGASSVGCRFGGSIAETADTVMWVDDSSQVRKSQGVQSAEISPPWVARLIEAETDDSALIAQAYSFGGLNWYEISGTAFTLRYNMDTNQWFERETYGAKRWRGQGAIKFAGKILIGDVRDGTIWHLDKDATADGDDEIVTRLLSTIVHASPVPLSVYSLHLDVIPALFSDPDRVRKCMLRLSADGGKSFGRPLTTNLGRQGEQRRAIWRRLGTYEKTGAVFEFSALAKDVSCIFDGAVNAQSGSA